MFSLISSFSLISFFVMRRFCPLQAPVIFYSAGHSVCLAGLLHVLSCPHSSRVCLKWGAFLLHSFFGTHCSIASTNRWYQSPGCSSSASTWYLFCTSMVCFCYSWWFSKFFFLIVCCAWCWRFCTPQSWGHCFATSILLGYSPIVTWHLCAWLGMSTVCHFFF